MKTTLDLPDDLLIAAKQVAIQRKTTLKELVTHSLRREIGFEAMPQIAPEGPYEISELGLPRLKKRREPVTDETIYELIEAADDEDVRDVTTGRQP